jgi:hypothetical protein
MRVGTLLAGSLPTETAEELAVAMQKFRRVQHLAFWAQTPTVQQAPVLSQTLVVGRERLFLLWPAGPMNAHLQGLSADAAQAWEHVSRLIPPDVPRHTHADA